MSLASLLDIPEDERGWLHWALDHSSHTLKIRSAIQTQFGVNQAIYVLDPIRFTHLKTRDDEDVLAPDEQWMENHQSDHNDFNSVLGLFGQDLTTVDFRDHLQRRAFADAHYLEHLAAATRLGI